MYQNLIIIKLMNSNIYMQKQIISGLEKVFQSQDFPNLIKPTLNTSKTN